MENIQEEVKKDLNEELEIVIKDNKRELKYSIRAIDWLDTVYTVNANGLVFGLGVQMLYQNIQMNNIPALQNALKAGLLHYKDISSADIEEYITRLAENDELEDLFNLITNTLGKSPLTKTTVKKLLQEIEKAQEN